MHKILIGCPTRQDEEVFKLYLQSLNELERGDNQVDYFFILHNSPNLKKYLKENEYTEITTNSKYVIGDTHYWQDDNLKEVTIMKNFLLHKTLSEGYDYLFLIDSDIILNKNVLLHLLEQKKNIISEIFWTKWTSQREEEPNAWTHDFYSFDNLNRLKLWREKNVYEVGGTGACILIHRNVIEAGVNYSPIKNVSFTNWEDRAFCIRANVLGFNIYLDTNYPAKHLYRGLKNG